MSLRSVCLATAVLLSACQSTLPIRQAQQIQSLRTGQTSLLHAVDGEGDILRHGPQDMSIQSLKGFTLRNGNLP